MELQGRNASENYVDIIYMNSAAILSKLIIFCSKSEGQENKLAA